MSEKGMIRFAAGGALLLVLAACGSGESPPEGENTAATQVEREQRLEDALVLVDANGLSGRGNSERAHLNFGASRDEVEQAVTRAYGSGPERSSNEECGAGPMEFSAYGPLQIAFLDGSFAGWFLRQGEGVVTSDGVAPGMTTFDGLRLEHQVQQLDTTLDGEFQYTTADFGTITGFAEPDGTITALQAGVSCFFR